jgi:hypothetical protein
MRFRTATIAVCAGIVAACASSADGAKSATPLLGQWGGPHVALTLTSTGGELEFDCAHGELAEAIRPDAGGNFSAAGRYLQEHGGPTRKEDDNAGQAAVYEGRVQKHHLTVRIRVGADVFGPFELELGQDGQVVKCR